MTALLLRVVIDLAIVLGLLDVRRTMRLVDVTIYD